MKHTHLSNFQKEQYTNYLETQLQKFSTFMLSQKKENQKYDVFEEAMAYQTGLINQMQEKVKLMEIYQTRIQDNYQHLFKKYEKLQQIQPRVCRLQDRERFDCDGLAKQNHSKNGKESIKLKENQEMRKLETNYSELNKRIKYIQEEIYQKNQIVRSFNSTKSYRDEDQLNQQMIEKFVDKKELKAVEKKIKKYVKQRIQGIEQILHKKQKRKSKSPSTRTPVAEMSIMNSYSIEQPQDYVKLPSFKISDSNCSRSDVSTIMKDSKSTVNNKKNEIGKQILKKKKHSKSRSRSKHNTSNLSEKSRSKSKSKSQNKKMDKSFNMSSDSILKSSISHSKSIKSKKGISKSKRQVGYCASHEKGHSISHEKCKRRPEYILDHIKSRIKSKIQKIPVKNQQKR